MPRNERLRQQRIARNWRQQEVADKLETALVTVQRWERGFQQPSAYYRVKLSALFGVSAQELGLLEDLSLGGERAEVSASGKLSHHRLPHRPPECALAICTSGAGSGPLPPHEEFAGGAAVRHRRIQADQRFLRAPRGRQVAA